MANEVYSGRDGVVKFGNTPPLTDISMMVADLAIDASTEEVTYTTLGRQNRVKVAGYKEETWTIRGPYNTESEAFWRPLAGEAAGKNQQFEVLPQGAVSGTPKWTGTCNVLSFESTGVNPDEIEEYETKLSILTKTIAPNAVTAARKK